MFVAQVEAILAKDRLPIQNIGAGLEPAAEKPFQAHGKCRPEARYGPYTGSMGARLAVTNPFLRDPDARARSVLRSVATSSAIEGIHAPFAQPTRSSGKSARTGRRSRQLKR